jgi:DNA-binding winged helix-turn-helix (wHTH) protein
MRISFGPCVLDVDAQQLWRDGTIVPLEPKMYEFLEILIQRRPAVVTNNELDELLWPNVYVARTSLTHLVSKLRSLLNDSARESKIIRTVYKRGYAFCASVSAVPATAAAAISLLWNEQLMPLTDGEHIAGRGAECSLVIDAKTVSRRHARIVVVAGRATIEDLSSTNGTFVDGTRIATVTPLASDTRIRLGSTLLLVKTRDPSALTVKADSSEPRKDIGAPR